MQEAKPLPGDFDTAAARPRQRSIDDRLREHHFRINSRPAKGPTLWERGPLSSPVVDTEADALRKCGKDDQKAK